MNDILKLTNLRELKLWFVFIDSYVFKVQAWVFVFSSNLKAYFFNKIVTQYLVVTKPSTESHVKQKLKVLL